MKRTNDTIEMLQYQLRRYKAMRKELVANLCNTSFRN